MDVFITARKLSYGKVMFSEAFVCPREGGSLSWGGLCPGDLCPEGESLSRGSLSGGSLSAGSLSGRGGGGGPCHRDPLLSPLR